MVFISLFLLSYDYLITRPYSCASHRQPLWHGRMYEHPQLFLGDNFWTQRYFWYRDNDSIWSLWLEWATWWIGDWVLSCSNELSNRDIYASSGRLGSLSRWSSGSSAKTRIYSISSRQWESFTYDLKKAPKPPKCVTLWGSNIRHPKHHPSSLRWEAYVFKGTPLYGAQDTSQDIWIKKNADWSAHSSNSYSQEELKEMLYYGTAACSIYSRLKRNWRNAVTLEEIENIFMLIESNLSEEEKEYLYSGDYKSADILWKNQFWAHF